MNAPKPKRFAAAAGLALLLMALLVPSAQAAFGFSSLDVEIADSVGDPVDQAGSHPHTYVTDFTLNAVPSPPAVSDPPTRPDGTLKDVVAELPVGMIGNPSIAPTCSFADFYDAETRKQGNCPLGSIVGRVGVDLGTEVQTVPIVNLVPSPGSAATFGFVAITLPVVLEARLSPEPPYRIVTTVADAYQAALVYGSKVTIWGNPADPVHDAQRGGSAGIPNQSFLTMPRSCPGTPLQFPLSIFSWEDPGVPVSGTPATPPMTGCETLPFAPEVGAAPTTNRAESPSGFDFTIDIDDPGLTDPGDRAASDLRKAIVTLPEGLAVNPASAGGLSACSAAQLAAETPTSAFGAGCPASSRLASVQVETPLLGQPLGGSVFLATPHQNPFNSLLAAYLVIKAPERGVAVKLAGKVDTDPATGQITASFDQNPQLPFSRLEVSFPPGPRASLVTPSLCGKYEVTSELFPWSGNPPLTDTDPFEVTQAASSGGCPTTEAALPNTPGFDAGSVEPLAGRYTPFVLNLRREDGSQRFSTVRVSPPPGLVGKLAGTARCPEAALVAAAERSGRAEEAAPRCPAASKVGEVFAAAGAGPAPYTALGKAYLSGPYKGAPISMAIITPATAGPFDLGTIVVRTALHVDPVTAQITAVSDPLPQILEGIPLDIRSASVHLDRPEFTLNPTSCDPTAVGGQLLSTLGQLASLSSRFQLAECGRLGFKPKMSLSLKGGTKRGGHPALTAVLRPGVGNANLAAISVALPSSEFLDQAHIRTVCTRVQFAAGSCPKAAIYGQATVHTPLLDEPLSGPVYLRSSDNTLPDLVPDLRGPADLPVRLEAAGRTDTVKGGIRNTFDFVPDAPFSKFVLRMQGAAKGLLVNSRDICRGTNRATVKATAHNGARIVLRPKLQAKCAKKGKRAKHRRGR